MPTPKILRNTVYNIVSGVIPSAVALVAIPLLIDRLKIERFGTLTLLWMILGYFTIFDMGASRAVTKFVSEYLAQGKREQIPLLVWTAWAMLAGFGLLGGIILFLLTPLLVDHVLNISKALIDETRRSFYMLAISVPFLIIALSFRGVLEAQNRFDLSSLVVTPSRILNYLAPILILPFSQRLDLIAAALLANQILTAAIYYRFCIISMPDLAVPRRPDRTYSKMLFGFGGWLTISNIVSPFMEYIDRFFIGAIASVSFVAYYTTPYEVISKLMVVPIAFTGVLFPLFSRMAVTRNNQSYLLFFCFTKISIVTITPIIVVLIVMAKAILDLWVGAEFAQQSVFVFKYLAFGILFVNSLGRIFSNWLHAHGRSDLTAKFHLIELPCYLILLWVMLTKFGINGVAITWVVRACVDTFLLYWFSGRYIPQKRLGSKQLLPALCVGVALYVTAELCSSILPDVFMKGILLSTLILGYGVLAWHRLLDESEKHLLTGEGKALVQKLKIAMGRS